MEIADLLIPRGVIAQLRVGNKKQALQEIARRAATLTGLAERRIYDVLTERERRESTGIGRGIAIPHGKLAELSRLYGLFARLERPIPFEAIDDQPVDLVFVLLGARRGRRRAFAGARPGLAPPARQRDLPEAARHRQCRRALRAPHRPYREPRRLAWASRAPPVSRRRNTAALTW